MGIRHRQAWAYNMDMYKVYYKEETSITCGISTCDSPRPLVQSMLDSAEEFEKNYKKI